MDFELSEEQSLLRKTVRDFAERELAPHSREWDEKQGFPREVFAKLGGLGVAGFCWPEEYGGGGLSTLDWAIVMEELARVDAGVALSLAAAQVAPDGAATADLHGAHLTCRITENRQPLTDDGGTFEGAKSGQGADDNDAILRDGNSLEIFQPLDVDKVLGPGATLAHFDHEVGAARERARSTPQFGKKGYGFLQVTRRKEFKIG